MSNNVSQSSSKGQSAAPNLMEQELRLKVGNKINQESITMWSSTAEQCEILSFVWDVQDIKKNFTQEIVSDEFKGGQKTGNLTWQFKVNPNGDDESNVTIGLEYHKFSMPLDKRPIRGAYKITILDKNWTILFATKSSTLAGFPQFETRWYPVFPVSELDQYLIDGSLLRIQVELVIETGLKHKKIEPQYFDEPLGLMD